jgi:curved DNA-binding protein CbpA
VTHYETLGVPSDASAADIKAAWRRMSSAAHPDREGGDAQAMADINRAYEVLGDPQRRAAYDAGGDGAAVLPLDEEAGQRLLELLQSVIAMATVRDPISAAREVLRQARNQLATAKAEAIERRGRMVKLRGKITARSGGTNLAHEIIDEQLRQIDRMLPVMDRGDAVHKRVAELLDEYQFVEERVVVQTGSFGSIYGLLGQQTGGRF